MPARLLLATDLSARCDRALDRAVQLAGQWHADLVALNILEFSQAPDMALTWAYGNEENNLQIAQRQLQQDIAGLPVRLSARIAQGDVAISIRETAVKDNCGLIVTGMARSETFGRFLPGSTVEKLARMVSLPLLVVRTRPHGAYRRILVATDFSDSSRHALHAAIRFFPDNELVLYHVHNTPLSGSMDESAGSRPAEHIVYPEYESFLDACDLTADMRRRLKFVAEDGALETALTHYIRTHGVDLVVMGTHGRSGLMSILLGSAAARLLDWLPCDTLIVRDPRAKAQENPGTS